MRASALVAALACGLAALVACDAGLSNPFASFEARCTALPATRFDIVAVPVRYAEDDTPLDPASDCPASRDYSKAYLRHLFKAEEILGQVLLSWHNIAFFQALTAAMRAAISEGRFEAFRRDFAARQCKAG